MNNVILQVGNAFVNEMLENFEYVVRAVSGVTVGQKLKWKIAL